LEHGVGGMMGFGVLDLHDNYAVVAAPRHRDSERLLSFWRQRAPDGIVMGRDVPSRTIAPLLSHVMVWEPVADGADMKVRLAGAALQRRFSGDLKGRVMSELYAPADFRDHRQDMLRVIESGVPLVLDSRISCGNIEHLHLEMVVLPILSPDRAHGWVLSGIFYFN
jgi:hypothetical protein